MNTTAINNISNNDILKKNVINNDVLKDDVLIGKQFNVCKEDSTYR